MSGLRLAMLAGLVAAVAACVPQINDGSTGQTGVGTGAEGSVSDPTSIAFFQQKVGDRVLFAVDQSTLSIEAKSILDAQAAWLGQNGDYNVVIEGHADEQGTTDYNLALGARRANAAREYLVSRGVASDRVKVVSYGKERPIEVCSEETCYARNRRAVTVLSGALTG